jgi:predicted Zn finger-like uncharacterized protein
MAETRVTCPECDTVLRLREPVPAGKYVRCPKCVTSFRPPADDADNALPVARKRDRDRRRDEDDYDNRPRRSRAGKKRQQKKGSGALIALVAVAAVLLLGGAAVAVAVLWPRSSDPKAVATGPDGAPKAAGKAAPGASAPNPATLKEGVEIGNRAPEIEGEDIDGTPFKLSDYRGKVVVLDFWGHW